MKKLLIVNLILFNSFVAFDQQYALALGIKGNRNYNGGASLTLKHFVKSNGAFEWNVGLGKNDFWCQGLFEMNYPLKKSLEWYWGVGADFGTWRNGFQFFSKPNQSYYSGVWSAVDGVIGLEYTFKQAPVNIAIDLGPMFRMYPYFGVTLSSGVALRYAF
jgi:hypothetical protein